MRVFCTLAKKNVRSVSISIMSSVNEMIMCSWVVIVIPEMFLLTLMCSANGSIINLKIKGNRTALSCAVRNLEGGQQGIGCLNPCRWDSI